MDSLCFSIKRQTTTHMQAILKQLMSCIGLSTSADTALQHDLDSDLEALLGECHSSPQPESPYFVSSVSTVLQNLPAHSLSKTEDLC